MHKLHFQVNGSTIGELSFPKNIWPLRNMPSRCNITTNQNQETVTQFIRDVYRESYDANISVRYPMLAYLTDEKQNILAALGFRYAQNSPLFCEQYLSQTINDMIQVPRHEIVEIGNLAANGSGCAPILFAAISAYFTQNGYTHAVLTATQWLEKRMHKMGLHSHKLAPANPELLLSKDESWGTYYATKPYVVAGSIVEGYKNLKSLVSFKEDQSNNEPQHLAMVSSL